MRGLATAFLILGCSFGSPLAQDGPKGIGFAQAEEGTWWCRDRDSATALACARQKCIDASAGQTCYPTRWCYPSGWAGLMIVWLPEFHATHIVCGMPGPAATEAALTSVCRASPEFSRCDLVMMIDPDGNQEDLDRAILPHDTDTPDN